MPAPDMPAPELPAPGTRPRPGPTLAKIVVAGPFSAGKSTLIRTISEVEVLSTERPVTGGSSSGKTETTVAMDFGRITVDEDLVLLLFGAPGQGRFAFMWEILGEGMLGYVLLVDNDQPEQLHQAATILAAFRAGSAAPFVVALNRADPLTAGDQARVRVALDLPTAVPVLGCDVTDRESVKAVLLALLVAAAAPGQPAAVPA